MFEFRYTLAENLEFILAVLGLLFAAWLAIMAEVFSERRSRLKTAIISIVVVLVIVLLLSVNGAYMGNYSRVPDVLYNSYQNAIQTLSVHGFRGEGVTGSQPIELGLIVEEQKPLGGSIEKKGTAVELTLGSIDQKPTPAPVTTDAPIETTAPIEHTDEPNETLSALAIIIDSYELFDDGFYFSKPDKETGGEWFVEYDKGLKGTFHYSRPLSEAEVADWYHGGSLYLVKDGQMIDMLSQGYAISCWSDYDGVFAVQFPDNLPAGDYVYKITNLIGGYSLESAPISFHYNG